MNITNDLIRIIGLLPFLLDKLGLRVETNWSYVCMCVCVRACVRACLRVCVCGTRACGDGVSPCEPPSQLWCPS